MRHIRHGNSSSLTYLTHHIPKVAEHRKSEEIPAIRLTGHFQRAAHHLLVLISGAAGIGKTTLVDDFIHQAEQRNSRILFLTRRFKHRATSRI